MRIATGMLAVLALLALAAGCGDWTGATGHEGRLRYVLYTEYEVPESDLEDARIVTGHRQWINVSLTSKGRDEIEHPDDIVHSADPSEGVQISTEHIDDRYIDLEVVPDFSILVSTPGEYRIESYEGDERVDWIELQFEVPGGFDLVAQVRAPWEDGWTTMHEETVTVEEGSQVTFQAAPTDDSGHRLAGDMTTELTVDPEWAVVPGVGVIEAWEDGIWTVGGEVNFYFIDPGTVTFTVTDPVSGASGDQVFEVQPIDRG